MRKYPGKKFCGHNGGAIVECGPSECYRIENNCRRHLAGMVRANRQMLDSFLENILKDCGPLPPAGIRAVAQERHGDVVALLLFVMSGQREVES